MKQVKLEHSTFEDDFQLVTDSQEIRGVLDSLPSGTPNVDNYDADEWGCLFVKVLKGDYVEVWGMSSGVPRLSQTVYQLFPYIDFSNNI